MNAKCVTKTFTAFTYCENKTPYETFLSKLRNNNPLERDNSDFQSLLDGGLTSKEALSKLNLKQPPATKKNLSIPGQCTATTKHVYLQRLSAPL